MSDYNYLKSGEGETYTLLGHKEIFKATAEETNGVYSLFESVTPAGEGIPMHVHHQEDETIFVLTGKYVIQVFEETFTASPGAYVKFPKGTPHGFRNLLDEESKFLCLMTPGGYEKFFEKAEALSDEPDMAKLAELALKHNMEIVGDVPDVPEE